MKNIQSPVIKERIIAEGLSDVYVVSSLIHFLYLIVRKPFSNCSKSELSSNIENSFLSQCYLHSLHHQTTSWQYVSKIDQDE